MENMGNLETHTLFSIDNLYECGKEIYGDDIPERIISLILNGKSVNILDESLKSHDTEVLKRKLKEKFPYIVKIEDVKNSSSKVKSFYAQFSTVNDIVKFKEDSFNILTFFNYYVTRRIGNSLSIEPTFPSRVKYDIKQHHTVYHITSINYVDSIKENGLRAKFKSSIREYPERIYLVFKDKIEYDSKWTKEFFNILCENNSRIIKDDGYAIFKIDLRGTRGDLYEDTVMLEDDVVFTLTNIPPKSCKLVYQSKEKS